MIARKIAKKATKKVKRRKPITGAVLTYAKYEKDETMEGSDNLRALHNSQRKQKMLDALTEHMGIVSYAADEAGISRAIHYIWIKDDPIYAEKVEEVNERRGDFVERKMLESVQDRVPSVMIFMAKTTLKHRGYQERHEFTGPNGGELRIGANLSITQARNEVPPAAIEEIVRKIAGGKGQAEAALERLKRK